MYVLLYLRLLFTLNITLERNRKFYLIPNQVRRHTGQIQLCHFGPKRRVKLTPDPKNDLKYDPNAKLTLDSAVGVPSDFNSNQMTKAKSDTDQTTAADPPLPSTYDKITKTTPDPVTVVLDPLTPAREVISLTPAVLQGEVYQVKTKITLETL